MADKKKTARSEITANLDKRIMERSVSRGTITKGDVEAHMKSLPDLTDEADNIADKVYPSDGSTR